MIGWIYDPDTPLRSVQLDVWIGDERVAQIEANESINIRSIPDAARAHGFSFSMPDGYPGDQTSVAKLVPDRDESSAIAIQSSAVLEKLNRASRNGLASYRSSSGGWRHSAQSRSYEKVVAVEEVLPSKPELASGDKFASASPKLKCLIEVDAVRHVVSGWVLDVRSPEKSLSIILDLGAEKSPPILADLADERLKESYGRHTAHGFKWRPSKQVNLATVERATVALSDDGAQQIESEVKPVDFLEYIGAALADVAEFTKAQRRHKSLFRVAPLVNSPVVEKSLGEFMLNLARAANDERNFGASSRFAKAAAALNPDDCEARFLTGVSLSRLGELQSAIQSFDYLWKLEWHPRRVGRELAPLLAESVKRGGHEFDLRQRGTLAEVVQKVLSIDPAAPFRLSVPNTLSGLGHVELAEALFDNHIAANPAVPEGYLAKSRHLFSQFRVNEAIALCRDIINKWPDNEIAQYNIKLFSRLLESSGREMSVSYALISFSGLKVRIYDPNSATLYSFDSSAEALRALAQLEFDWLLFQDETVSVDWVNFSRVCKEHHKAGFFKYSNDAKAFHTRTMLDLHESRLIDGDSALNEQLMKFESWYSRKSFAPDTQRARVALVSRHGAIKFGGVEHFMEGMAHHYRSKGFDPILVGTRPDKAGEAGFRNDIEYLFISDNPASLRELFIRRDVGIVHCFPGLGYQVAEATSRTNIQFIYGVHFWRDSLGSMASDVFFGEDGSPLARREFQIIIESADLYVNSEFTQQVIEEAHGVRCPIVNSVPED